MRRTSARASPTSRQDAARGLHAGLVQFRMDLLPRLVISLENLRDERRQLAALRMHDLVLLFDPKGERGRFHVGLSVEVKAYGPGRKEHRQAKRRLRAVDSGIP